MTVATINKINAAIAKHGVEVVKGDGYFWFTSVDPDTVVLLDIPSVYSAHLRCMTLEQWVAHVETNQPAAGVRA